MAAPIGPPGGARELRSRVCIQRRSSASTPLGGTSTTWTTLIGFRRAKLVPMSARRGNAEQVIAARLQSTALWDAWLRWDSLTSTILPSDRLCQLDPSGDPITGSPFNIRWVEDLDQRRLWIFMQLEAGVAEG